MTVLVPRRRILRPQLSIPRLNFRRLGDSAFNRLGVRGQPWGLGNAVAPVAPAAPTGEIVCRATRFVARTGSTGSQNVTTPDLGGLTPKAVLFIGTSCITDGIAAAHTQMSFGAATGASEEWVLMTNSEDGQSTTDTHRELQTDGCILYTGPGGGADTAKADLTTFIADGCTLNWSVVDAAFLITAIFFAGADLSAHANIIDLADTINNAVDITDPGFEPDLVIAATSNGLSAGSALTSNQVSYGFCSNDGAGGIVQRGIASQFRTARSGTTESAEWTNDDCTVRGISAPGAADWRGSFGTFDVNGFTCTTLDAGANDSDLCYLALNFGGVANSWVGTHTTPTSGGNNSDTGPGFTPQLVARLMTQVDTVNTAVQSGDASGTHGVSAMDADDEFAVSISDEDAIALGISNCQSLSDNVAIELPDDDGTAGLTATFVSFDGTGWTDNYSAVKGTAGLMPAFAIESI